MIFGWICFFDLQMVIQQLLMLHIKKLVIPMEISIENGMDFMLAIFKITQGVVFKFFATASILNSTNAVLPQSIIDAIEVCGFFEPILLWQLH